ncbi:MAG TPA: glycosyltransferase family 39 protein, partial [Dehalococcoidia bacterium]|nr:glycosyltransferase family 39 protein [Dehalococcoidia bacterium]
MSNPLLVAGGYGAPPIAAAAPTARVRLRADVLIPLLLSLLPVLLYLPFVNDPLDADAGVYSTVARGILDGQIPYRDLFDHKQPLLYTWYMLSFLLFGEEGAALRVLVLFHLAATTVMVYWCGCLLLGSRIRGYLAAAAFGLTPGMAYATDFGDARFLMLTPLVAGLLAYVVGYRTGRAWWYVASGALSGLAVTTVAVAALNLLALAVFTLYMGMAGRTRYLRNIGALGLGAGVVFVLAVLPFALTSTLGEFVYANVTFNLQYPTSPAFSAGTVLGLLWLFLIVAGPLVFLSGLGAWLFLRESPLEGRLLIGWVGASLAAFFLTGKMAEHYLIGLFP